MESTLNQVTSFDTVCTGSYESNSYDIHRMPVCQEGLSPKPSATEDFTSKGPRLSRPRACHQKSLIGVVLGSIWIRTSILKAEEESNGLAVSSRLSLLLYSTLRHGLPGLVFDTERRLIFNTPRLRTGNSTSQY